MLKRHLQHYHDCKFIQKAHQVPVQSILEPGSLGVCEPRAASHIYFSIAKRTTVTYQPRDSKRLLSVFPEGCFNCFFHWVVGTGSSDKSLPRVRPENASRLTGGISRLTDVRMEKRTSQHGHPAPRSHPRVGPQRDQAHAISPSNSWSCIHRQPIAPHSEPPFIP